MTMVASAAGWFPPFWSQGHQSDTGKWGTLDIRRTTSLGKNVLHIQSITMQAKQVYLSKIIYSVIRMVIDLIVEPELVVYI